jgi:hypothetical protein
MVQSFSPQKFMLILQSIQSIVWNRVILISLVLAVLLFGMAITPFMDKTNAALAAPLPIVQPLLAESNPPDLEHAANKAEEASEQIYEGLDRTKRVVGKTEPRNEVIEQAREHASNKWKSLADKTRTAKDGDESLSPVDRQNLERISGSDSQ